LKAPWFQPLNLKCDILVSNFAAFKFNLYLLHLGNKLPLYDGVTGEMVDELTDARWGCTS
jgi:hypothetical protein